MTNKALFKKLKRMQAFLISIVMMISIMGQVTMALPGVEQENTQIVTEEPAAINPEENVDSSIVPSCA